MAYDRNGNSKFSRNDHSWPDSDTTEDSLIVSPITNGAIRHGKLAWVDLVTAVPQEAIDFYAAVFDWRAKYFPDRNYAELSHDGQLISSVVRFEDGEAEDGDARWLVSISRQAFLAWLPKRLAVDEVL